MKRRTFLESCTAGTVTLLAASPDSAQAADTPLEEAFLHPPMSARVKTWWHWMNGNPTADGITRDLEAMKQVGVGGFQIFDVGTGIPKGPTIYLSPEWLRLMQHAAKEAERLGLEFDMHNCPGWSSSGGTWITPELAMQQVVWTETYVRAPSGQAVAVALPQPSANLGYYRDALVLAYPSLTGEHADPVRGGGPGETPLVLEFAEPFEARSISVYSARPAGGRSGGRPPAGPELSLEASDDGVAFRTVYAGLRGAGEVPAFAGFAPVRAKYFRIVSPQPAGIVEVRLSGASRLANWPLKANFLDRGAQPPGPPPTGPAIDPASVRDVTRFMDAQGRLNWDAPAGNWTILRIGHTPTGRQNVSAPDTGLGLECDKYSRAAMEFHFNKMFAGLLPALRPLIAKGLAGALIDSYEVGYQNWTPEFPQEFQRRRKYDLRNYLPAITGRIVGSPEASERFLWDIRRTCADLIADNYYGRFAELCRQNGMKPYTEPYSGGPFEEMQIGSRVDIPMGEFWVGERLHRSVKLAASVGHVFGKTVIGAESFTGRPQFAKWQESPYRLKPLGDWMYTQGLNQFIFHRYAQQPHPTAVPGMTMGQWGWHFDRTNTWWNQGASWHEYSARCQNLLRQGVFVADLAYFTGEDAPESTPTLNALAPAPPPGYDWDTVNAEAILTRMKIENGSIVLPGGMAYRVLVLPEKKTVTLEVLRKIRDLVEQGMCLVGPKPESSPSLSGYPQADGELRRIAAEVWGNLDGAAATERAFGKGRVFWGQPLRSVLDKLGIQPDFDLTARAPDAPVNFIHRRTAAADIYFVANRRRSSEDLVCTFRVDRTLPEFWNPENGEIAPAPVYDLVDGRVRVAMRLAPAGSVFVIFRSPAPARRLQAISKDGTEVAAATPFPTPSPGRHRSVAGNFTIGVWVKPDSDVALGTGAASYVFYPPAGEVLYGPGHSACGLSVGRNGVCVYERSRGNPSAAMTVTMPIAGWTHVALVYREGVPSLYLDGKLVQQGRKSAAIVHPGLGDAYQGDGAYYCDGHMSEPELFNEPLAADRIAKLAAAGMPRPEEPPAVEPGLLVWQDGSYSLRDSAGRITSFQVSGIGRPVDIAGPWRVAFPPNLGAPAEITLPELISLHKHSDSGVKYFSGTATYSKSFNAAANSGAKRLYLDLGWVEAIAEVRLNGRHLGILWKPPYRVDITGAVRAGNNNLEVLVTNLWPNRLIGDEQLPPENDYSANGAIQKLPDWYAQGKPKPAGGRVTFATWKHYSKDSPLLESGLLGPVRLRTAVRHSIERLP